MKKSIKSQGFAMTQHLRLALAALVLMVAVSPLGAFSLLADTDVPAITMFYPGQVGEDATPTILKPTTTAYVYFATGSKVSQAKAQVIQGGKVLGTVLYTATAPSTTLSMKPTANNNNETLDKLQDGEFKISIYEVTYIVDGATKVYSDEANPLGVVRYMRPVANGKVTSVKGLDDGLVRSYYPADSDEGLRVYTFSKPVQPEKVYAYYMYGMGEKMFNTALPFQISADGLTLTVDVRGKSYSVNSMAPGVIFVDEMGEEVDPPTSITLVVENLVCADGSKIQTTAVSLDGLHSATVEGQIWEAFNYQDISFPTPVLTAIQYYSSANPGKKYTAINDDTDMFELSLTGGEYIASADVVFTTPAGTASVADGSLVKAGGAYSGALPASVKSHGSSGIKVGLDNVKYNYDDGEDHKINTLGASSIAEVFSVAELKNVAVGTTVVLDVDNGIAVTMSNDMGYVFAEDATGGLQLIDVNPKSLPQGSLVCGRIYGTYQGNGAFKVDLAASEVTMQTADVSTGAINSDIAAIIAGNYDYMLVTIVASDACPIAGDAQGILVGNELFAVTDLVDGYAAPAEIANVTGVVYRSGSELLLLVRSMADINIDLGTSSIASATADSHNDIYNLRGIKVNADRLPPGIYIVGGKKVMVK